jgi:hypothetical protein
MSEPTEPTIAPVEKPAPPKPTADQLLAERKAAESKAIAERNAAIEKRADELKVYEGRYFAPNIPVKGFPNQIVKVLNYIGVRYTMSGEAHVFRVESWNPDRIYQPSATQFLSDFHEVPAPVEKLIQELPA